MKIKLSQIYNNKPYYVVTHKDGRIEHAFGYAQIKKCVDVARSRKEKIEIVDSFLDEHSKLLGLLKEETKLVKK